MARSESVAEAVLASAAPDGGATQVDAARPAGADASLSTACESSDQVIDALYRRHTENREVRDERSADRYPWAVRLALSLVKADGESDSMTVRTNDLSVDGFSFLLDREVAPETIVITMFKALPNCPRLTCVVRHCVRVDETTFRVGVRFETATPNPERR